MKRNKDMERGTKVSIVKVDKILEKNCQETYCFVQWKLIIFKQTQNVLVSEQTVLKGHCLCVCHMCLCVFMSAWMCLCLYIPVCLYLHVLCVGERV